MTYVRQKLPVPASFWWHICILLVHWLRRVSSFAVKNRNVGHNFVEWYLVYFLSWFGDGFILIWVVSWNFTAFILSEVSLAFLIIMIANCFLSWGRSLPIWFTYLSTVPVNLETYSVVSYFPPLLHSLISFNNSTSLRTHSHGVSSAIIYIILWTSFRRVSSPPPPSIQSMSIFSAYHIRSWENSSHSK